MTSSDRLVAAARCWERAGFFEDAAERFITAEAWLDAGRCFSRAERHGDAAIAYSRADEQLLEAREHLMESRPERARSLYERLRAGPFVSRPAEVEVLLGLDGLEDAARALALGDPEATDSFARLASTRGRPDLAAPWWRQRPQLFWESFARWNHSLRWLIQTSEESIWPKVEFSEVSLVPIWKEAASYPWYGSRALDWSADSKYFAAALSYQGFVRCRVSPKGIQLERHTGVTNCLRFLPGSHAVLIGEEGGKVRKLEERDYGPVALLQDLGLLVNVWSISFSSQSDRVALAAYTSRGALLKTWSWNSAGHAESLLEETHTTLGNCVPLSVWSPDGCRLIWSPGPFRQANNLFVSGQEVSQAHGDLITSINFTADSRFLITASHDHTVIVRDGVTGQALAPPECFTNQVNGATVHPRAALVAVGEGTRLHLLRLQPGDAARLSRLSELTLGEGLKSLAFSPDGRHLLVMTGTVPPVSGHLHLFRVDLKP